MTTSCEQPTAGWLMCRSGCGWAVVYRTFADEPEALRLRDTHELVCDRQPTSRGQR